MSNNHRWRQEVLECRECLEIVPRHESGYCGDCRLVVCPECNGSGRRGDGVDAELCGVRGKRRCPQESVVKWIYFVKVDNSFFKIGSTGGISKRMKEHQNNSLVATHNIEFLAGVRGSKSDETSVHKYFREWNANDKPELFHLCAEIAEYIRWLRDCYYVIVDEAAQSDSIPVMGYDIWCPTPERRKKARSLFAASCPYEFADRQITGDDFYTPEWIIECSRTAMGSIDFDPASHPIANEVVKAKRFYTLHDDGLHQKWHGHAWLNPPFSQWDKWSAKICPEKGRVEQICIFVATRTLTAQYFRDVLEASNAMCIITGRHKNWGPKATPSPDDGHCILYRGLHSDRFMESFASHGVTYRR